MFTNGLGDWGSIPGRVIPKTQKMVLDAALLNTQHYKVRIKGKVEQSREWRVPSPTTLFSSFFTLLYTWCHHLCSCSSLGDIKKFSTQPRRKWPFVLKFLLNFLKRVREIWKLMCQVSWTLGRICGILCFMIQGYFLLDWTENFSGSPFQLLFI